MSFLDETCEGYHYRCGRPIRLYFVVFITAGSKISLCTLIARIATIRTSILIDGLT